MPERHGIDRLIRRLVGTPTPTTVERESAEQQLHELIQAKQPMRRRRPAVAWGAAAIALVVSLVFVLQPGSISPAGAAMEELASLAEQVEPVEATDARFVYTKSDTTSLFLVPSEGLSGVPFDREYLAYHENAIRESWIGSTNTVQISVTKLRPTFFSAADETTYYAAGIEEQDQVGETITSTVSQPEERTWPPDPGELDAAIRQDVVADTDLSPSVQYVNIALDIIRESSASPELRASTMRLIGEVDGLELVGIDAEQTATFAISYEEQDIDKRLTFSIDTSGYLRLEEILRTEDDPEFGIPAQTVESRISSDQPKLVESLKSP